MKSLLAKILLALLASVVLALLAAMMISRAGLQRGFLDFLELQEARQLQNLIPELAEIYQREGSWDMLQRRPAMWQRLVARTRPRGPGNHLPERPAPPGPVAPPAGRERGMPGPGGRDALQFRNRLFLLDADKSPVAGAEYRQEPGVTLEAVEVDSLVVGWVGFRELKEAWTPEARRFLRGQNRFAMISLGIALVLAALLAVVLARQILRPVGRLRDTVRELTGGNFEARAEVETRDEIGTLADGVNRLASTLQKNETARRRWMADIAHELRTPIAILKGELEAIEDGVRDQDERTVNSLKEEVSHLANLVDDLQTLALADAGALRFERQTVDFSALLRQLAEVFEDRLIRRDISLRMSLQDAIMVTGDAQRLRQLLNNLLENACRYTDPGGAVSIELVADNEAAHFLLEDSVPGVTDGQLERLFERFYRPDAGRSRAAGGSGLGLSICKNIVEAHDGLIKAEQSRLGGIAIKLSLPLSKV
jgi:two-component system sensor histidine kinase BaeS